MAAAATAASAASAASQTTLAHLPFRRSEGDDDGVPGSSLGGVVMFALVLFVVWVWWRQKGRVPSGARVGRLLGLAAQEGATAPATVRKTHLGQGAWLITAIGERRAYVLTMDRHGVLNCIDKYDVDASAAVAAGAGAEHA